MFIVLQIAVVVLGKLGSDGSTTLSPHGSSPRTPGDRSRLLENRNSLLCSRLRNASERTRLSQRNSCSPTRRRYVSFAPTSSLTTSNHVIAYVQKWIAIQKEDVSQDTVEQNLRHLTAGYVAITDTPAIQFTEELTKLFPDAIVICTSRDKDEWWKSAKALMKNTGFWWLDIVFWPMPTLRLFGNWRDSVGQR